MITPNQFTILEALIAGPGWARSFQTVLPLLRDLEEQGLIERCRPHLGRARNMVRLTKAGADLLEIEFESVPAEREAPTPAKKPRPALGAIKPDLPDETRQRCEAFVRAFKAGADPGAIVAQLAEAGGVQRPAIWRALRSGGLLPEKLRAPVRGRKSPTPAASETFQTAAATSRDPCPRCEVRGDIGCRHSRAPLATAKFG